MDEISHYFGGGKTLAVEQTKMSEAETWYGHLTLTSRVRGELAVTHSTQLSKPKQKPHTVQWRTSEKGKRNLFPKGALSTAVSLLSFSQMHKRFSGLLGSSLGSNANSSFLLMYTLGGCRAPCQVVGSLSPSWDT